MALNFRILIHENNGNLKLKLRGNFDGSSAFELINTIKAHSGKGGKIIIHTQGLSAIHPFGVGVFQKNCFIKKLSRSLAFTGKYGALIMPQKGMSLG